MTWRPLTSSNGTVKDVKFDADGRIIVRTRQDCDDILSMNKLERNHGRAGKEWRHIASIPTTIIHKWLQEGIDVFSGECQDALARKLNDPDWSYLRTAPGVIGVSNGVAR